MKTGRKKINYNLRLKSSTSLSFRLCFYIACFMFLSFRLVTSLTGAAYANSAADDGQKSSRSSVITSIDPNNINALELLRADLSVAYSKKDTKSKDQLKKLIEQIRSVDFEPQKQQVPEPIVVPKQSQPPTAEPNETVPDVPVQKEQIKQVFKPQPQHGQISETTLQMLQTLAQKPEMIADTLELGEVLFVSGNLKEAAVFYSEALKRRDPNDADASIDRAWIMFQIGNCLRNDDMPTAAKMYQQLLTEYPNSPWVELATARNNLIAWYLKDEPLKLIQQLKHDGRIQANNK